MIDFVTGRGRRVHMRDMEHAHRTVCGVMWDKPVPQAAIDRDDMCHNCLATYAWSQAGGDRIVPRAPAPAPAPVG
jgi:hypothetical protein